MSTRWKVLGSILTAALLGLAGCAEDDFGQSDSYQGSIAFEPDVDAGPDADADSDDDSDTPFDDWDGDGDGVPDPRDPRDGRDPVEPVEPDGPCEGFQDWGSNSDCQDGLEPTDLAPVSSGIP